MSLIVLIVLAVLPPRLPAAPVYFAGTGHWYEAINVPEGMTWPSAFTNAILRGGYLCTITNASENDFAASLADISYYSGVSVNNDILGPWLGGLRHAGGSWQWVTGENWSYTKWYTGQPDGYGGSEQRLQFYARATTGSTWGDHPGTPITGFSLPRGFIVEYNQQPMDQYTVDWWTVDGGGDTSTDGRFTVTGTIGQPDSSEAMTNGQYSLTGGFWSLYALQVPGGPLLTITLTSTNTALVWWSSPSTGFILQQNTNLNTTNWVPPPEPVNDDGTNKFITVNLPTGVRIHRLYRLFKL